MIKQNKAAEIKRKGILAIYNQAKVLKISGEAVAFRQ